MASAHLIAAVMRIFVDIEYTGDSLEFEAKFREETSSLSFASLSTKSYYTYDLTEHKLHVHT